ncbi:MAG: outer membrane lipoprotein carrier protein LolA [Proteobacteria bacterium]|nr:outer membrane lipoprotein carrier protein LolA [Pseudomonadota bacterium]MBI3499720.1 outer membrane lipoprotein carrier protein LolA [Pseudomonadota bacterium]
MRMPILAAAALALGLALLPAPDLAAKPPEPAPLNDRDRADLSRIEGYLNGVRTMVSPFMQTASDGSVASGTLFLQRPGKLRIEYDPPTPVLIVSASGQLVYYDKTLQQVTYVPTSSTPAGVLVQEPVQLSGEVTVTRLQHGPGVIRVTLARTAEPEAGRVTLIFSDQPLQLKQWTVVDGQGIETQVALLDPVLGGPIDPKRFEFTDPRTRSSGAR